MSRTKRLSLLACLAAAAGLAACESVPTGPSLSNVSFTSLGKLPTIGDPTVCCCHATGSVTNNNSVPVHVTITIAAMNASNQQLSRVPAFVPDLQPGTTRNVEAAGFILACDDIARLDYELNVSSLGRSLR